MNTSAAIQLFLKICLLVVGNQGLAASSALTENKKLILVKVSFLEALAPKDTTSSDRFQKEYDFAIQTGKDLTKQKLADCGYQIIEDQNLYDASDTLQAAESAKKSQDIGAWLIVGPRRSNHYLLSVKGAPETPSISIMASSKEVFTLDSKHLTMAQSNEAMAQALAKKVTDAAKDQKTKIKTKNYISIVSEDCVTCLDFSKAFDQSIQSAGFKKVGELRIIGEQPSAKEIEKFYKKHKASIVLIPNYSKLSAYLIGAIYKINPKVLFLGGDGWGDNKYGFVHNSPQLKKASGYTVKGFPPADKGLEFFDLGKQILSEPTKAAAFPASGTAQALLKTLDGLSQLLCETKPQNKKDFVKSFTEHGKDYFQNPWGVSLFKLTNGEVIFEKQCGEKIG